MPWFPEFVSGVELARSLTRAAGQADPVRQYVAALNEGDIHLLETAWPGEVVVHDPRYGEIRGHKRLRQFVRNSQSWLAERHARVETVASTAAGDRAVVELLAHLAYDGRELAWPVAVVAESQDDRSVAFRSYFSRWGIEGRRHLRPAILEPGPARPGDVVGRYQAALAAGDVAAVVRTFEPDGYYREPAGPPFVHRGATELGSFFTMCFGAGGGIGLQACAVTDDGVRCAVEYNCVRWGSRDLPPQAGIGVYERGPDGLLAAVRTYDDVEPPGAGGLPDAPQPWRVTVVPDAVREAAMTTSEDRSSDTSGTAKVDMKLEVVVVPVSDVDRAKEFYGRLGWRLDADRAGEEFRLVQFTPPGSWCSVQFGTNLTPAAPGSAQALLLTVSDIDAARGELARRGVEVGEVFHCATGAACRFRDGEGVFQRVSGPAPEHASYSSYVAFSDPDGNGWLLQEVTTRLAGRVDAAAGTAFASAADLAGAMRRASAAHGEHEKRIGAADPDWPDWYAAYMVAEQAGTELPT